MAHRHSSWNVPPSAPFVVQYFIAPGVNLPPGNLSPKTWVGLTFVISFRLCFPWVSPPHGLLLTSLCYPGMILTNFINSAEGPLPHTDRKSTRLNSSHYCASRMPSSARKNKTMYN